VKRIAGREIPLFQLRIIHLPTFSTTMNTPTLARTLLRHSTRSAVNSPRVCGKKSFSSISSSIQSSLNRSTTLSARPRYSNASSSSSLFGEPSLPAFEQSRDKFRLPHPFLNLRNPSQHLNKDAPCSSKPRLHPTPTHSNSSLANPSPLPEPTNSSMQVLLPRLLWPTDSSTFPT